MTNRIVELRLGEKVSAGRHTLTEIDENAGYKMNRHQRRQYAKIQWGNVTPKGLWVPVK